MTKRLRIALGQIHCHVGTDDDILSKNIDSIWSAYSKAVEQDCDIAVLPELSVCGYGPEDALLRKDVQTKIMNASNSLIDRVLSTKNKTSLFFGSPRITNKDVTQGLQSLTTLDLAENPLANTIVAVIPSENKVAEFYKRHLPNWGIFDEVRWFAAAKEVAEPIEINGVKVGVLNCRDIWKQENVAEIVGKGAEIIIVPNASPYANNRHKERIRTVSNYAMKYSIPVVYVNMIEGCDEAVFDGGSFVVNYKGELQAELPRFVESFLAVDIDIQSQKTTSIETEYFPDLSSFLTDEFDEEETYNAVVLGTKEFYNSLDENSEVVIGLSGGVDSALIATIAVDALGAERVHGVLLPSRFTSNESTHYANELVNNLGISVETISIEKMHQSAIEELNLDNLESIVGENVQSRLRGMTIMMLSNSRHWLPIATSNKTEVAVGYFTLYGDSVGAYTPIKDVYKTDVYRLCNWRNANDDFEVKTPIPQAIIDRAPTAELRENQTDESSLYPYETLDGVLKLFVDWDMDIDTIIEQGYDKDIVNRIVSLVKSSEFKRKQSPIGPRLTRRNFGKDRRIPISYRW